MFESLKEDSSFERGEREREKEKMMDGLELVRELSGPRHNHVWRKTEQSGGGKIISWGSIGKAEKKIES